MRRYHHETVTTLKPSQRSKKYRDRPLALDREFSYLELMENLILEGLNFVIRLKVGSKFTDQEGKIVALTVSKGETRVINKVFYMGKLINLQKG